jgi:GAF domain-containing protein
MSSVEADLQPGDSERRDFMFNHFRSVLHTEGVRESLAYLAGLCDYRYTAVVCVQDGFARTRAYIDRLNPHVVDPGDVPDTLSYCAIVTRTRKPFRTDDALADERLRGHPARELVRAYCGLPLFNEDNHVTGVVCHWDSTPRDSSQLDYLLLLEVAGALARDSRLN